MKLLLVSLMVLVAVGCAGRWVQPGKTDLDARRDNFDCENVIVTKHGGDGNPRVYAGEGISFGKKLRLRCHACAIDRLEG